MIIVRYYSLYFFSLLTRACIYLFDIRLILALEAFAPRWYIEVAHALIKWNADINIANGDGFTPLVASCGEGHIELRSVNIGYFCRDL